MTHRIHTSLLLPASELSLPSMPKFVYCTFSITAVRARRMTHTWYRACSTIPQPRRPSNRTSQCTRYSPKIPSRVSDLVEAALEDNQEASRERKTMHTFSPKSNPVGSLHCGTPCEAYCLERTALRAWTRSNDDKGSIKIVFQIRANKYRDYVTISAPYHIQFFCIKFHSLVCRHTHRHSNYILGTWGPTQTCTRW